MFYRPVSRRTSRSLRDGFTLVELMIVIVLVGLLAGVVSISVRSYMASGKQRIARLEIARICEAIDLYQITFNRYPPTDEGLEALVKPNDQFPHGMLKKTVVPKDPWGNPYEYIQPGRNGPYEVICYGADGREGGDGGDKDISSDDVSEEKNLPK